MEQKQDRFSRLIDRSFGPVELQLLSFLSFSYLESNMALVNVIATYETSRQRRGVANCLWSLEARAPPPHEGSSTFVNVRRHRIVFTLLYFFLFFFSYFFFFLFFFLPSFIICWIYLRQSLNITARGSIKINHTEYIV